MDIYQKGGQKWVYSCEYAKQSLFLLLFINYCIIFHMNNCKPTFVHPCIKLQLCSCGACSLKGSTSLLKKLTWENSSSV